MAYRTEAAYLKAQGVTFDYDKEGGTVLIRIKGITDYDDGDLYLLEYEPNEPAVSLIYRALLECVNSLDKLGPNECIEYLSEQWSGPDIFINEVKAFADILYALHFKTWRD